MEYNNPPHKHTEIRHTDKAIRNQYQADKGTGDDIRRHTML